MPPKKEQNPTPPKESGEKHSRFDLVPLDAPRLSHKRYEGKGGYQDYLSDYKMYRASLVEYRLEGTLQRQQKVVVTVDPAKAGAATLTWEVKQVPGNQIPPYKSEFGMVDSTGRETSTIDAGEAPRVFWRRDKKSLRVFGKTAETLSVGDKLQVPFVGFQSNLQMAEITITGYTIVGKAAATFAEKVKKPRGPAVTPKKVRTAEEISERAAKEKARKENLKWRKEHEAMLSKGKLEERLAKSAVIRAAAIKKADGSVETEVDLEGWRVVTKPRREKTRERVKEVAVAGGSTVTKTYTKS